MAGGDRARAAAAGHPRRDSRRASRRGLELLTALALAHAVMLACSGSAAPPVAPRHSDPSAADTATALLDDVERRTFLFFWDQAHPNGLIPDRWPRRSFASVAATGFGITAYPIGIERGWIRRAEGRDRVLATLRFLHDAPQGATPRGVTGYRGFFYHFLEPTTGERFEQVELSTVDTTLLLGGVLFAQSYFERADPAERQIRELAEAIYRRVEWNWARPNPPAISHGWHPEHGFIHSDWRGYNEAMLVYLLALGSPTHPVDPQAWAEWTRPYRVVDFEGQRYVDFAPLFGHQYSHVWVDFRGLHDEVMGRLGWDYFENSRRATLAQRAWAMRNPRGWRGLGENIWGVTACDGPADVEHQVGLEVRRFWTYAGRGVGPGFTVEDGTVAPTAAGSSIAFTPQESLAALAAMRAEHGEHLYSTYGFLDAFNPSFDFDVRVQHGRVVRGKGWYDTDYLGIDQGPLLAMIENHRSELIWKTLRRNPHLVRGLRRAGFSGGWLDAAPDAPAH